jgi:catechol 2,3-dioxygenase
METGTAYRLPDSTHIRSIHLRTPELSSLADFYSRILGLTEIRRHRSSAYLAPSAAANSIVILTEQKDALPRSRKTAGLFHTAIRFPERKDLASMFVRLNECKYPLEGFADHGVSEALYLSDPDGNGVELYADRPRNEWQFVDGQLQMVTKELDIDNLLAELPKKFRWSGIHPRTVIGHVHLNVSDLSRAEAFYCGGLGFKVMQRNFPGALFISAAEYHHHIGLNTWTGRGTGPIPDNTTGLVRFGVDLGNHGALQAFTSYVQDAGIAFTKQDNSVLVRDRDNIEAEIL